MRLTFGRSGIEQNEPKVPLLAGKQRHMVDSQSR
jgi:hypothetical protein